MSLKIHSVVNSNNPNEEFVRLKTTEKINLKGILNNTKIHIEK